MGFKVLLGSTEFYSAYFGGKSPVERENDLKSFLTLASSIFCFAMNFILVKSGSSMPEEGVSRHSKTSKSRNSSKRLDSEL